MPTDGEKGMVKAIIVTLGKITFKDLTIEDPDIGGFFFGFKGDEGELRLSVQHALRVEVLALKAEWPSTLIRKIGKLEIQSERIE